MIQKKICLLGSFAAGKTSLISRFVRGIFSGQYLVTVGVKIDSKDIEIAGETIRLVIWDLAGEDEFNKVNPAYLRGAAGFLLVADGTRRATLNQAKVLQKRVSEAMGPLPFVTLINKCDLVSDWEIPETDLQALRADGWEVIHSSARTGEGVEAAFASLARRAAAKGPR